MRVLSEEQINTLIHEAKSIPEGLCPVGKMTERNQHQRKDYEVACESGNKYLIAIRQSCLNALDFSVILGYQLPNVYTIFRLRRYNGKHYHTNAIEANTFYGFHIHTATERYQKPGFKEDHFAETTNRYWSLESAIQCLLLDCGFRSPIEEAPLFSQAGQP
jgi:lysozyme family protein